MSVGTNGRLTNALGHVTLYAYDSANRLTSTTAANGLVTAYTYDNRDRLLTQTVGYGLAGAQITTLTRVGHGSNGITIDPLETLAQVERAAVLTRSARTVNEVYRIVRTSRVHCIPAYQWASRRFERPQCREPMRPSTFHQPFATPKDTLEVVLGGKTHGFNWRLAQSDQ